MQLRKNTRKSRPGKRLLEQFSNDYPLLESTDYLDSLVNLDETNAHRVPDEVSATSAVFKSPTITLLPSTGVWNPSTGATDPPGTAGETVVALFPGIRSSVWHSSSTGKVLLTSLDSEVLRPAMLPSMNELSQTIPPKAFIEHALQAGSNGVVPRVDNNGQPWYEIAILDDVDEKLNAQFAITIDARAPLNIAATVIVETFYKNATVGDGSVTTPVQIGEPSVISIPGLCSAFSWEITSDVQIGAWYLVLATKTATSSFTTRVEIAAGSCQNFDVRDVPDLTALDRTKSERTSALTGLVTYMGSTLQNGGVISYARLPRGLTPIRADNGDFYNYLARQPFYSGNFPLKDGAYAWWCPDDEQELFFRPYLEPRSMWLDTTSSLWFAMRRDDVSQDVRLDTVQAVEVLTRSVQYDSQAGPVDPNFPILLAAAKTLPAGSENAVHTEFFKRVLRRLKTMITKPDNIRKIINGVFKLVT